MWVRVRVRRSRRHYGRRRITILMGVIGEGRKGCGDVWVRVRGTRRHYGRRRITILMGVIG